MLFARLRVEHNSIISQDEHYFVSSIAIYLIASICISIGKASMWHWKIALCSIHCTMYNNSPFSSFCESTPLSWKTMLPSANSTYPLMLFVSFILRHIASIDFHTVFLIYDDETAFDANTIAAALQSLHVPYVSIRIIDDLDQEPPADSVDLAFGTKSLLISLVDEVDLMFLFMRTTVIDLMVKMYPENMYLFVVPYAKRDISNIVEEIEMIIMNRLYVLLPQDDRSGLDFIAWFVEQKSHEMFPLLLHGESELEASYQWQVFRDRANCLPMSGTVVLTKVYAVKTIRMDTVRYNGRLYLSGTLPGVVGLVLEKMGGKMELQNFNRQGLISCNVGDVLEVAFVDRRTSIECDWKNSTYNAHQMTIGGPETRVRNVLPWTLDRFELLAPSKLVPSNGADMGIAMRLIMLLVISIPILGIFSIRMLCHRLTPHQAIHPIALLLDTVSLSLGISSGSRMPVAKTAERQLKVVTSVFYILMSSCLSGILYEQFITAGYVQFYKTLKDLENANVSIVPIMLSNVGLRWMLGFDV